MPLYLYEHKRTGEQKEILQTMAKRRAPRGWRRVMTAPAAVGFAADPHTQAAGVLQGLKDMEHKYGTAEMQKQLGSDISLRDMKTTWEKN